MWFTREADGFRAWFAVKQNSGALRTGAPSGNFVVSVVNPGDTATTTPTVTESVQKPGVYTFLIPNTFLTTHGVGGYAVVVEVNILLAPKVTDVFSQVLRVYEENFDSLATSISTVNTNVVTVDGKVDAVGAAVAAVSAALAIVDTEIGVIDGKIDSVSAAIAVVDGKVVAVDAKVVALAAAVAAVPAAAAAAVLTSLVDGAITVQVALQRLNAMARGKIELSGATTKPAQDSVYYSEAGVVLFTNRNTGDERNPVP